MYLLSPSWLSQSSIVCIGRQTPRHPSKISAHIISAPRGRSEDQSHCDEDSSRGAAFAQACDGVRRGGFTDPSSARASMANARFCQRPKMGVTSGATSRSCVEQEDIMQAMATETFIGNMRGPVIRPMDADYDAVRSLYNGMIDKSPAMIARCTDVADVVTAVNFARQNDLQPAIRGGGHNGPGLGSVDDGLMIDMSMMKGVRVDPTARTVRVGPGCTQGDVDHATHIYGLAVPAGIVSTTGIAGLTLGGGTGYLTRKYGLTIDNLLEADVVLADGRIVTANKSENADLYWGLRGGGGNFGIVTSFLFQAHPGNMVYAGPVFWDLKEARTVMQTYRDFLSGAPEELGAFVGLKTVPPVDPFPAEHQGKRACAIIACYNGPTEDGQAVMAKLLGELPPPLFNWMRSE